MSKFLENSIITFFAISIVIVILCLISLIFSVIETKYIFLLLISVVIIWLIIYFLFDAFNPSYKISNEQNVEKVILFKKLKVFKIIRLILMLNLAIWMIVCMFIGGDSLSGKSEINHYFVGEKGVFTEVSLFVYNYSMLHTIATILSAPIFMILMCYVDFLEEDFERRVEGK